MLLLLSDTHLDDQPDNEYRWDCFEHVHAAIDRRAVTAVYHLGDFVDRKDRFASAFVNRLLAEIENVGARVPFTILKGNHDDPLRGPAFFEFVNGMVSGVRFITKPPPDGTTVPLQLALMRTPSSDSSSVNRPSSTSPLIRARASPRWTLPRTLSAQSGCRSSNSVALPLFRRVSGSLKSARHRP